MAAGEREEYDGPRIEKGQPMRAFWSGVSAVILFTTLLTAPAGAVAASADLLPASEVAARISSQCTMESSRILARLQGLGSTQLFTTIRHRGDFDSLIPENSLAAFDASYTKCRPGVETDVRRTRDSQFVVFHDLNIGKMLEPTFDPDTNTGPNPRLDSLTMAQLREKNLVRIDRVETDQTVPTLSEVLQRFVDVDARSLLYLEIKPSSTDQEANRREILDIVRIARAVSQDNPDADLFKRIVFKFRMSAFPTYEQWHTRLVTEQLLSLQPMVQIATSRQISNELRNAGIQPRSAVTSWASAPSDDVLSVEVTMKDSSGFQNTEYVNGRTGIEPHRSAKYYRPTNMTVANTVDDTMAQMSAIVRQHHKPLGQFVPIPDWVLWRAPNTFTWDQPLRNDVPGFGKVPVTPAEANFNNNSACCYALRDRIDNRVSGGDRDAEQNDQRIFLPWLEDIGATVLTADDTDSIDSYFKGRNKFLDMGDNQVQPNMPDPAMNSILYPGEAHLPSLLKMVIVDRVTLNSAQSGLTGHVWGEIDILERRSSDQNPVTTQPWTVYDRELHDNDRIAPGRDLPNLGGGGLAVYGDAAINVTFWLNRSVGGTIRGGQRSEYQHCRRR